MVGFLHAGPKVPKSSESESAPLSGTSAGVLAVEVLVYSALVAVYLLLVLRGLRPVLLAAERSHRVLYGFAAIALMLGQGIVLELLTTLLVGRFRRARRDDARRA
jgi:hypothetical protein